MHTYIGVIAMGGDYVDDPWTVAKMYVKGALAFDCLTSFPVSFFELVAQAACKKAEVSGAGVDSTSLRMIRSIKPLRWFKIARVFKLGKAGPLVHQVMDHYNISPKQGKTFKVAVMLIVSIHMISCLFWLWKVLAMCPPDQNDPVAGGCEEIDSFLDSQPFNGGAERHRLDTVQGKIEAYVISVYVVTMTLTTVGYGDINAKNTAERAGYIVLFIVGAFIWGNLLAEITEIHTSSSAGEQQKTGKLQKTLEFLVENECPPKLRKDIVQWTRFDQDRSYTYTHTHYLSIYIGRASTNTSRIHTHTHDQDRPYINIYIYCRLSK